VLSVRLGDLDDRDIERAPAQIVHGEFLVPALLVHAIGERRGRRLVDDTLDLQARYPSGILGGLALRVVEVGGDRDDRLFHALAEIILGGLLHLLQNPRLDLRGRHLLAIRLDPGIVVVRLDDLVRHHVDVALHHVFVIAPADQALDGEQGVLGVGDGLALGGLPHQDLAVAAEGHHGGGGTRALLVLDHLGPVALHDRHAGVGGTEIDADHFTHGISPLSFPRYRTVAGN